MDKQRLLRVVNILMGIFFLVIALTGIFHELIPYAFYEKVHPAAGFIFTILAVMHLKLNWGWIKINIFKSGAKKQ